MSAFIVNKAHINAMLQGAISVAQYSPNFTWYVGNDKRELTAFNTDEIGQMLSDENIKSVGYRYEDSELTNLPGRIDVEYLIPFQHHPMGKIPTAVELIKITHCYMYQSCEHEGWEGSNAKAFCKALIRKGVSLCGKRSTNQSAPTGESMRSQETSRA